MKINLEKQYDDKKVLNNGDVIIVKECDSEVIHTLLYFAQDEGVSGEWPVLVSLDEYWTESVDYRLPDNLKSDETSLEEAVTYYIENILVCSIVEVIPSEKIELRRI